MKFFYIFSIWEETRNKECLSIDSFQKSTIAVYRLEPGTQPRFPVWVPESQLLEPSPNASHSHVLHEEEAGIESRNWELNLSIPMWDASILIGRPNPCQWSFKFHWWEKSLKHQIRQQAKHCKLFTQFQKKNKKFLERQKAAWPVFRRQKQKASGEQTALSCWHQYMQAPLCPPVLGLAPSSQPK